jgi:hypothetical protein
VREAIHIDDLGRPRLPWPIRAFNAVGRPLSARLWSIDEEDLLAAARKREGLSDFGSASFRGPLRVLLGALRNEARLSALGCFLTRQLLVQLLATRLRVEELIRRHPEILAEEIRAPIFIVGLPRTGTTHLHNLLSQHPALRSLPYWESLEPVPRALDRVAAGEPDSRRQSCEQALRFQHWVMPLFPLMHEMTVEARHEEIQLLALELSTMLFESMYVVPSYRDWYRRSDQTPAYGYLKRMLQVLQWLRGPKRWVLKSPQHLEQIGPILSVFPDAFVVFTHRDPVRVTASFCTMGAYGLRMQNEGIDVRAVGSYWSARIEDLLRAAVAGRDSIPPGQGMDVRFHEFMHDDLAMAERVLDFAGEPLSEDARRKIECYLAEHRRGRHGTIDYRLEDFGLDAAERRAALGFYQERFGIPDE